MFPALTLGTGRRALRAAAVVALALVLAVGPLGLMQIVAWAGMAVTYSGRYGLAEGIGRTFDGKNPCPMCKKIAKARQDERAPGPAVTLSPGKLEGLVAPAVQIPRAKLRPGLRDYFPSQAALSARAERPAVPPPRSAAA